MFNISDGLNCMSLAFTVSKFSYSVIIIHVVIVVKYYWFLLEIIDFFKSKFPLRLYKPEAGKISNPSSSSSPHLL